MFEEFRERIIKAHADKSARWRSIIRMGNVFPISGSLINNIMQETDDGWRKFCREGGKKKSRELCSIPFITIVAFAERMNTTALISRNEKDDLPAWTMFRCWTMRCYLSITESSTQTNRIELLNIKLRHSQFSTWNFYSVHVETKYFRWLNLNKSIRWPFIDHSSFLPFASLIAGTFS